MLVYLDEAYQRRLKILKKLSISDLKEVVMEGAVERLRPKIMTVATTTLGLLPVMIGNETGVRIMKRIAAPMVGGLISSMILTLVILPAIYLIWKSLQHRRDF